MGGAIGTPLLSTIFLLMAALVCTFKKNGKASHGDVSQEQTNTQMNDSMHHKTEMSYDDIHGGKWINGG